MSHAATNWAIRQRGIKPALKVVLWHLCDCHNPAYGGSFPSQEYLAAECEIPRSTLNVYLDQLEKAGLIVREQRRQPGSQRQERTRYYFPFEPEFAEKKAANPCPETGHGEEEAESRNQPEPSPEISESRVQNLDSNLVIEPVRETSKEREGARELAEDRGDTPGTADFEKRVMRFCSGEGFIEGEWPKWTGSTPGYIARQFARLTPDERRDAEKNRDAFLAKCRRDKTTPMPVGNFFRDKAWLALSERDIAIAAEVAARKTGHVAAIKPNGWAASFSPQHGAAYFRILISGPDKPEHAPKNGVWFSQHMRAAWPRLFHFWQQSDLKGGLIVAPCDFKLADRMQFVPADTPAMDAWKGFFRDKGLPEPRIMSSGAYFPSGGPDGLAEFECVVRGLFEARNEDDAA